MAESKRYYWLRLQEDFFSSKRIKKLRKLAGGDTYTIIYLKMQLLSIKTEGVLTYTGLENSFAEELALDIDEDVENVVVTLNYLKGCGLIETSDDIKYLLPYAVENTGSEGSSAQRMRESRAKVSQCANNVRTMCALRDGEIEKEIEIDNKYINIYAQRFDVFWSNYPRKANKADAKKAFLKLKVSEELLAKMLDTLSKAKQTEQWQKDGGAYIPYPAKWLRGGCWDDDTTTYQKRLSAEGRVIDDAEYANISF